MIHGVTKINPVIAVHLTKYLFDQMFAKQINFSTTFFNLSKIKSHCLTIKFKFAKNWQNFYSRRLTKPAEVQLTRLSIKKNMAWVLRYLIPANLKKVG